MERLNLLVTVLVCSLLFIFSGCSGAGNPVAINREELLNLPIEYTPGYGFRVSFDESIADMSYNVLPEIDERFTELSDCLYENDLIPQDIAPEKLLADGRLDPQWFIDRYRIIIVPSEFECGYHNWCGGEHGNPSGTIIIAWSTPEGEDMAFLEQEIAEAYVGFEVGNKPAYGQCVQLDSDE